MLLELGVFERATSAALRGNFLAAPGYLLKLYFSPAGEGILNIHRDVAGETEPFAN